ncbi:helix-turn-helix transcriptional regulator [Paenibacillus sp. PK4536]|uniref:helix-turn-helix domain-containing protein n=1 Tax=Paenibacillus sp. PK4536 TaxID=3024576 RepID=UPI0023594A25|nr:helix-turn-helix transcriptional regulator [Paenibacillus sp. PK4536]WIM38636.1 helix-turn-helix transcriptional regulator [Paenibacillus sp. PK4536]
MLNGERLREERITQNLTQEDMAKKLGITRQAYGNYETGKRDVDSQTLVNLVKILNVSSDYLLNLSEMKQKNFINKEDFSKIKTWTNEEKKLAHLVIESWRKLQKDNEDNA